MIKSNDLGYCYSSPGWADHLYAKRLQRSGFNSTPDYLLCFIRPAPPLSCPLSTLILNSSGHNTHFGSSFIHLVSHTRPTIAVRRLFMQTLRNCVAGIKDSRAQSSRQDIQRGPAVNGLLPPSAVQESRVWICATVGIPTWDSWMTLRTATTATWAACP